LPLVHRQFKDPGLGIGGFSILHTLVRRAGATTTTFPSATSYRGRNPENSGFTAHPPVRKFNGEIWRWGGPFSFIPPAPFKLTILTYLFFFSICEPLLLFTQGKTAKGTTFGSLNALQVFFGNLEC